MKDLIGKGIDYSSKRQGGEGRTGKWKGQWAAKTVRKQEIKATYLDDLV